jgi:hypothetical protein
MKFKVYPEKGEYCIFNIAICNNEGKLHLLMDETIARSLGLSLDMYQQKIIEFKGFKAPNGISGFRNRQDAQIAIENFIEPTMIMNKIAG